MGRTHWTADEMLTVRTMREQGATAKAIAEAVGRSVKSIESLVTTRRLGKKAYVREKPFIADHEIVRLLRDGRTIADLCRTYAVSRPRIRNLVRDHPDIRAMIESRRYRPELVGNTRPRPRVTLLELHGNAVVALAAEGKSRKEVAAELGITMNAIHTITVARSVHWKRVRHIVQNMPRMATIQTQYWTDAARDLARRTGPVFRADINRCRTADDFRRPPTHYVVGSRIVPTAEMIAMSR